MTWEEKNELLLKEKKLIYTFQTGVWQIIYNKTQSL